MNRRRLIEAARIDGASSASGTRTASSGAASGVGTAEIVGAVGAGPVGAAAVAPS